MSAASAKYAVSPPERCVGSSPRSVAFITFSSDNGWTASSRLEPPCAEPPERRLEAAERDEPPRREEPNMFTQKLRGCANCDPTKIHDELERNKNPAQTCAPASCGDATWPLPTGRRSAPLHAAEVHA